MEANVFWTHDFENESNMAIPFAKFNHGDAECKVLYIDLVFVHFINFK